MANATASTLTRNRRAVLLVAGVSVAFAAWLVISSSNGSNSADLRRSNAVRRPRNRSRRARRTSHSAALTILLHQFQQDPPNLGEVEFLGNRLPIDVSGLPTAAELREIALRTQPDAPSDLVEASIREFYRTFLDRLLLSVYPNRATTEPERDALLAWLESSDISRVSIFSSLFRHTSRFQPEPDGIPVADGRHTPADTEVSWNTTGGLGEAGTTSGDGQTLRRTLYHIAEDRARSEGVIHRGVSCDGCDAKPIRGVRWRCANCADFDLCSDCEATNSHYKTHIFYKIKVPAPYLGLPKQPPVYPGRPNCMRHSIETSLRRRLVSETKMEGEEVEALWDQFTCLAGTEWKDDPNSVGYALNRSTFNQAFIPRYSTFNSTPNLIYDRIFAHYDTNNDGLIGFEEFVKGLDAMHSRDAEIKLRIVFDGYDIDGDGYISRKDVLRIFRAYYAIEKEATRNYIADITDELSVAGALDTIRSGQPLGSAFNQMGIHAARAHRRLESKTPDRYGDLRGSQPVIEDIEDTADRDDILGMTEIGEVLRMDPITGDPIFPSREAQENAVRERWNRRQYYIDEEEGLRRPEGLEEAIEDQEEDNNEATGEASATQDGQETPNGSLGRQRGSRSSSRVRFQDDVDFETRSNASTSSRPIGERWGGYEIPEPEKDLGKEVLYQITQQAFNELLNPLFRDKEDLAMDAVATRAERRKLSTKLDELNKDFDKEAHLNRAAAYLGAYGYSRLMASLYPPALSTDQAYFEALKVHEITRTEAFEHLAWSFWDQEKKYLKRTRIPDNFKPSALELWDAKLVRLQFLREMRGTLLELYEACGWLPVHGHTSVDTELLDVQSVANDRSASPSPSDQVENAHFHGVALPSSPETGQPLHRDPTMPQFRPNTTADLAPADTVSSSSSSNMTSSGTSPGSAERTFSTPSETGDPYASLPWEEVFPPRQRKHTGPFFFETGRVDTTPQTSESEEPSSAYFHPNIDNYLTPPTADLSRSQSPGPPPPISPRNASPSPMQPQQTLFSFTLNATTTLPILAVQSRTIPSSPPSSTLRDTHVVERDIRRSAQDPSSPCYMARLASLEAVELEMSERKGSGLLSLEEFKSTVMREGRLRFLEVWMEWVSF